MTTPTTVFVRLSPLPGQREFTRSLISELLPDIRALQGCEVYDLFDEVGGDLMLLERWSSREDWQAHFDAPPILRLKAELAQRVELPVERLETYPASD
jgi:quinol monooxygenase YgiN